MKKNIFSFAAGAALGAATSTLLDNKNRQKMQKAVNEQAKKFYNNYGNQVVASAGKVTKMVKSQLS